jgi:ribonuclease P/MRP protein subunit POP3
VLSSIDEADIVDLLCRLLEPIGDYRREHVRPSKGKSSRKRKREVKRTLTQESTDAAAATPAHPIPDIFSHITLGFNTTIRHLESLSAISRPQSLGEASLEHLQDAAAKSVERLAPLSAVFVCRTGLPPILTSCLPLLTATASLAFPDLPPIRLVPLGKSAEGKLAQALNQPKVGFVGLQSDISSAGVLLDTVRSRVEPVDVPWLKEASIGEYLPVKVKQTEVKVGPKKEKATHSIHDNSGSE